jgi:hypothetical protein
MYFGMYKEAAEPIIIATLVVIVTTRVVIITTPVVIITTRW